MYRKPECIFLTLTRGRGRRPILGSSTFKPNLWGYDGAPRRSKRHPTPHRAPNLHVLTCTEPRPAPTHPDALHKSDSSALPVLGGEVTRAVSPHQHRCLSPRPRQLSEQHGVALLIIKSKPPPPPHHSNDRTRPHRASQHQQPALAAR